MWTTSILPESCRLVIEETLPRGMYVDPDQLRDLSEMGILNTYVPGNIIVSCKQYEVIKTIRIFGSSYNVSRFSQTYIDEC